MNIVIIGGGASGMYAACHAAESGASVTVLERNRTCGVKLNLTGKGRCNVTNNCDMQTLIDNVPRNGKFLYSAFSAHSPQDVMSFLESRGVPLKTERGARVFPVSDNAKDVSGALKTYMSRHGVRVVHARAKRIVTENGTVSGVLCENGDVLECERIILATGGLSYPATGSDGDGYRLAKELGHTIEPTKPSLVPLIASGSICGRLEGLALKNITISVCCNGKEVYSDIGELLFTANGVSGPLALSASAHIKAFPCSFKINLKPALDAQTLDKRVLRDFADNVNRDFSNSLGALLPSSLIPVVIELSGIPPAQKVNTITKAQREKLCEVLSAFELEIISTAPYSEAIITSGGVNTREINPKTMESKLVHGLYFAGEVIDADGYTGGFNLQIAWSTAFLAGTYAAKRSGD